MAAKNDFTQRELDKLIKFVRINSALHNPEFKNNPRREELWNEFSEFIGKPVVECKAKWRYLRDYYRKLTRRQPLTAGKVGSELLNKLSFLSTSTAQNSFAKYEQPCSESENDDNNHQDIITSNDNLSDSSPTPLFSTEKRIKMAEKLREIQMENQNRNFELINPKEDPIVQVQVQDRFDQFFLSMAAVARQLHPKEQVRVMREVAKTMGELEDKSLDRTLS